MWGQPPSAVPGPQARALDSDWSKDKESSFARRTAGGGCSHISNTKKKTDGREARLSVVCTVLSYPRESVQIRGERSWAYFNSSTSFSFPLLISSIFLISPSVSF